MTASGGGPAPLLALLGPPLGRARPAGRRAAGRHLAARAHPATPAAGVHGRGGHPAAVGHQRRHLLLAAAAGEPGQRQPGPDEHPDHRCGPQGAAGNLPTGRPCCDCQRCRRHPPTRPAPPLPPAPPLTRLPALRPAGAVNVVFTFVGILLIDRAGRRALLIPGGLQMMLCSAALAGIMARGFEGGSPQLERGTALAALVSRADCRPPPAAPCPLQRTAPGAAPRGPPGPRSPQPAPLAPARPRRSSSACLWRALRTAGA